MRIRRAHRSAFGRVWEWEKQSGFISPFRICISGMNLDKHYCKEILKDSKKRPCLVNMGQITLLDIFISRRFYTEKKHRFYTEIYAPSRFCVKSVLFFLCKICAKPDFGKMSISVGPNTSLKSEINPLCFSHSQRRSGVRYGLSPSHLSHPLTSLSPSHFSHPLTSLSPLSPLSLL